jgi:two-component system chemotaxis sensor kinase CheA
MEVIVKPMEGILAGLRGFAGTTLLGDGRVLLILDLRELVV